MRSDAVVIYRESGGGAYGAELRVRTQTLFNASYFTIHTVVFTLYNTTYNKQQQQQKTLYGLQKIQNTLERDPHPRCGALRHIIYSLSYNNRVWVAQTHTQSHNAHTHRTHICVVYNTTHATLAGNGVGIRQASCIYSTHARRQQAAAADAAAALPHVVFCDRSRVLRRCVYVVETRATKTYVETTHNTRYSLSSHMASNNDGM